TAEDANMTVMEQQLPGPLSSAEYPLTDMERFEDIERKHRRIGELLGTHDLDALLIQKPANFAWFTSGGSCVLGDGSEPAAALFITSDARVVAAGNTDSGHIFDVELPGLGFQLKERPWYEPRSTLLEDLCRGRKVGSDSSFLGTMDVSADLAVM